MNQGIESRLIIHNILIEIKLKSLSFDKSYNLATKNNRISSSDKKFIYNAVFTTIRNSILITKIIKIISSKIDLNSDSYFLLLSSLSQIIFLNIKNYAVVNSMVELSKLKQIKSSPNFINGCLRSFLRKKNIFLKTQITFEDLPTWLKKNLENISKKNKDSLIEILSEQPTLHIVFKNIYNSNIYKNIGKLTSKKSMAVEKDITFNKIPNFDDGEWWVQDLSSMLPLSLIDLSKKNLIADVGSAPGGKLFQIIMENKNVIAYEKNQNRAKLLKENLKRLNLNPKIKILDFLKIENSKLFDVIVLDAPCTAIGTIRRNPEILFKNEKPKFNSLADIQYSLLEKASKNLKKDGLIIYMVCSFLDIETILQIDKFLKKNKNFSLERFSYKKNEISKDFINKEGMFATYPKTIFKNIKVDGYFACKLKKNDI